MKKTALVMALAVVLVFVLRLDAMARTRFPSVPVPPRPLTPRAHTTTGPVTSRTSPPTRQPRHRMANYATSTVKCAVCHSVHAASPAGDTLLKVDASDACAYCT